MSKLIKEAEQNNKKLFLQFGGQGSPYLKEISKLYKEEVLLKEFFETVFQSLSRQESTFTKSDKRFEQGYDLKSWMENPDSAPSEDYQARASVSVVMIFVTQIAHYHLATLKGYDPSILANFVGGSTGHSQGVIAATLAGLSLSGKAFYEALSNYIDYMFYLAFHAQGGFMEFEYSKEVIDGNLAIGDKNPAPMVAVIGYTKDELEERVSRANKELGFSGQDLLHISLYNTPESMIISARPSSLLKFREKFKQEMDETKRKFVYLKTSAPFHSPFMDHTWAGFSNDWKSGKFSFPYQSSDLKFPVYSIFDGEDYRKKSVELGEAIYKDVVIRPLYWDKAVSTLFTDTSFLAVLDFGPSSVTSKLTSGQLTPRNITTPVYCAAVPKDLKNIFE
ncbi:MAG: ACP S-malonyltransferase [Leptospiraceae bacterium]|nr:ACP S-malonyltransferase [Leptospiraceae bacterium]